MPQRKVPMRTCVGCREVKPKRELIRVVRTTEDEIVVDLTGKKSGRGTYICPRRGCLDAAAKGKRLDRALSRSVGPDVLAALALALPADEEG